jgi:hypothetical protein
VQQGHPIILTGDIKEKNVPPTHHAAVLRRIPLPRTSVNKSGGDSESSFCARHDPGEPECAVHSNPYQKPGKVETGWVKPHRRPASKLRLVCAR